MRFLQELKWGASKPAVRAVLGAANEGAPHPTQNAIGFILTEYGIPWAVVCYFRRAIFSDKLARINVLPPDDVSQSMSDEDASVIYRQVKDDLSAIYGVARKMPDTLHAPAEYQLSEMLVWVDTKAPSVITLSLALKGHGLGHKPPIAIGAGDPAHDPSSKMLRGLRA